MAAPLSGPPEMLLTLPQREDWDIRMEYHLITIISGSEDVTPIVAPRLQHNNSSQAKVCPVSGIWTALLEKSKEIKSLCACLSAEQLSLHLTFSFQVFL